MFVLTLVFYKEVTIRTQIFFKSSAKEKNLVLPLVFQRKVLVLFWKTEYNSKLFRDGVLGYNPKIVCWLGDVLFITFMSNFIDWGRGYFLRQSHMLINWIIIISYLMTIEQILKGNTKTVFLTIRERNKNWWGVNNRLNNWEEWG